MRIWSKGLGKMVLTMDFRKYYTELDPGGDLLIKGQITEPVFWNFVITVKKDDIRGLANIVFKFRFLIYLVSNVPNMVKFFFLKLFRKQLFEHPEKNIEIAGR